MKPRGQAKAEIQKKKARRVTRRRVRCSAWLGAFGRLRMSDELLGFITCAGLFFGLCLLFFCYTPFHNAYVQFFYSLFDRFGQVGGIYE